MKPKTIKAVLRKKIDAWLKSIDDEDLRLNIYNNCIVTGGAIASMLLNEDVNDFDVYFTNKQTAKRAAAYYLKKFLAKNSKYDKNSMYLDDEDSADQNAGRIKIVVRSAGEAGETEESNADTATSSHAALHRAAQEKLAEKSEYRPIYLSANAISLSDDVQLVIRFYGDPKEIHKNYDFVHATNSWESCDGHLILRKDALVALMNKDLVYVGSKYPLASMIRIRKFLQRGFTINVGQMLKIAWQISELEMDCIGVLEEQLTGVDVAYFNMLIDALKEKKKEFADFSIDYDYVCELIDRIF